jgi:hypothetical protein
MAAKSRSAKFYSENKASREKKQAYDKKLNSKPEQVKKRVEANKYNREKGTYGNGDGKDAAHKGGKIVGLKDQSKNRGSKRDSAGDRRARGKK